MSGEGINGSGIAPEDPLARFIYSASHFSRGNQRVKHNAFMPGADGKTSVFQTKGLDEPATWGIGKAVGAKRS